MTCPNLKSTIQAILAANIAAMQSDSPSLVFTHIILYGDLDTLQEATDVITYTNTIAEQSELPAPKMLYISAPWRTLKVDSRGPSPIKNQTDQINNFWANFRGDEASFLGGTIDSIPMQVKVINIYTALKLRYANQICVIGFRSGFLEAAGFLGIPIFYMNETNIDDRPDLNFSDGQMLWHGPYAQKINNRLGECSNHIITFIAVDVPGPKVTATRHRGLPKQSVEPHSQGKKQLTIPGPKVTATRQRVLSKENVELNSQGKKQLMAALYMYMLSEDKYGNLLWQRRREMMRSKPPTATEPPNLSTASTHHTSASTPSTSTHTVADEALGEGQIILKRRYEECEALWTVSGSRIDKSSPQYRVRALVS